MSNLIKDSKKIIANTYKTATVAAANETNILSDTLVTRAATSNMSILVDIVGIGILTTLYSIIIG